MREVVTVKNLHVHKFCISSRFGYFFGFDHALKVFL